jgi:hypothetical protein
MDLSIVLEGMRRDLHIRREISTGAKLLKQAKCDCQVLAARNERGDIRLLEPAAHSTDGILDRQGSRKHTPVRGDA